MTADNQHLPSVRADLPPAHAAFLESALPRLHDDERIVAVAAGGSYLTGGMDEFSDLDLVVVVEPDRAPAVMDERRTIAESLGPLLAAFTGEHVGEPRLLICLYGPPLLHVDFKFLSLDDAADRVEDPVILWERDGRLTSACEASGAAFPTPDLQWIEDRFWVWVHYITVKVERGEVFEAIDGLGFLRGRVLGPLALQSEGARPTGVRRVETAARPYVADLLETLPTYDAIGCLDALAVTATLYRSLREQVAPATLVRSDRAESAVIRFLAETRERLALR